MVIFKILGTRCEIVIRKGFTKLHGELLKLRGGFHLSLTTVAYETAVVPHGNSSTLTEVSSWGLCHVANNQELA